jgi:hypothetical protein
MKFTDFLYSQFERSEPVMAHQSHDEPEIFQEWVSELELDDLDRYAEKWKELK